LERSGKTQNVITAINAQGSMAAPGARIVPCMPGAELTEVVDERTYKGKISVPLGPVAVAFAGVMKVEEVNPANHTARVTARGADAKESGGANATASFRLEPEGGGSKVLMHMEVALSGSVAQYGHGRMMRQRRRREERLRHSDRQWPRAQCPALVIKRFSSGRRTCLKPLQTFLSTRLSSLGSSTSSA
jgi:carbon monoxide dehydrogenase subunit G